MNVTKRLCLTEHTITDLEGTSFTLLAGKEYTTSAEPRNGEVTVFSRYWVRVPISIFQQEPEVATPDPARILKPDGSQGTGSATPDPSFSSSVGIDTITALIEKLEHAINYAYAGSAERGSFVKGGGGEWVPCVFLTLNQLKAAVAVLSAPLPAPQLTIPELTAEQFADILRPALPAPHEDDKP